MTTPLLRTPSVDFLVDTQGSDPRAVFVHGFGGDLHTWDLLWSAFGAGLSALRYDLRGFGQSASRGRVPFDHAEDLLSILDAGGIERCDLVGVSMGASIALNFTLDNPERVSSLVLMSPGLVGWEWSAAWREHLGPIEAMARSGALDEARRLWWEHPLFATTRDSAAAAVLLESIRRYSGAQWLHDDHRLMLPDVERLHLLKTPTLLLTGGRDLDEFRLIASLIAASSNAVQRSDDLWLH